MRFPPNSHSTLVTSRLISNPFATRFVAPGRIPWIGTEATDLQSLSRRFLDELGARGAIIGPHGTGKTTTLVHLMPMLGRVRYRHLIGEPPQLSEASESNLIWLQLRAQNQPWRTVLSSREHWGNGRILILDGFEQLSRLLRYWLIATTKLRKTGLLVTAHTAVPLPTLYATSMNLETAVRVIRHVHPTWLEDAHRKSALASLLEKHHQNLREVMMDLYDAVEQQSR